MFPFPDVVKFFADEFAGLGGRRFSHAHIGAGPFHRCLIWHGVILAQNVPARGGVVAERGAELGGMRLSASSAIPQIAFRRGRGGCNLQLVDEVVERESPL
jgi:hypothetical protein